MPAAAETTTKCRVCGYYRFPAQGCRYNPRHPRCENFAPDTTPKFIGGQDRIPGGNHKKGGERKPMSQESRDRIGEQVRQRCAARRAAKAAEAQLNPPPPPPKRPRGRPRKKPPPPFAPAPLPRA